MFRVCRRRLFIVQSRAFFPPADLNIKTFEPEETSRIEEGSRFDEQWAMYFKSTSSGEKISPWHNIPLIASSSSSSTSPRKPTLDPRIHPSFPFLPMSPKTEFYYVNEISKGMREKLECAPKRELNPIIQDRNKDKSLRKFSYGDLPFNYGFFPRTFEDPDVTDIHTRLQGDGDPVDVVFLTPEAVPVGAIRKCRVVGCFGLLDQGETDWKVLAVPVDSPAKNIEDVPQPVQVGVYEWFKMYKTSDGKPENKFAFEGQPQDAHFTINLLSDLSKQYLEACYGSAEAEGKGGEKAKKLWV